MENNQVNDAPVQEQELNQDQVEQVVENAVEASGVAKPESAEQKAVEAKKEAEIKRNLKKFKLKVDGQEIEEEIDLDDEKELTNRLQLAKVSQKRMQQSAEERKQIKELFEMLKSAPEDVMRELGMDPEDFAVQLLNKRIEEQQKSPEQREIEKLQKELEGHKKAKEKEQAERQKLELERRQAEYETKISTGIQDALEKSGLPKTRKVVKAFADNLLIALDNGLDLSPNDLIPIVKKEIYDDIKELMSISPDEMITELLGKERFNNMRKKQVAAVKKNIETASQVKPTGNNVEKKEEKKDEKKISMSDFLRG
jgi:hypothetical protein